MLQAINGLFGFVGDLLETDPYQNSTGNMISDDSGFTTLATFQASQLFGFAVKLLDFPTKAAHFLYSLRVVLRHVVGHNLVRALGSEHNPEEFHLMITRKAFDLDYFAMLFFSFCPFQRIHPPIRL